MAAQQSSRVLKTTSKKGEEVEMEWVVTDFETLTVRSTKDLSFPFIACSTLGFDAEWELCCTKLSDYSHFFLFLKRVSGPGNNVPMVGKLEIQINPESKEVRTALCNSSDIDVRRMVDLYKSLGIEGINIDNPVYQNCSYSLFPSNNVSHSLKHVLINGGFTLRLKFNLEVETITTKVDDTNIIASTLVECVQIQKAKMLALLESGDGSDVILKTADGHDIPVHKCILFAHSDVFKAMLMKEKQCGIVDLEDIGLDALKIFLKFLYTGDMDLNWGDHYEEIIRAGEKYQVDMVQTWCDNLLGTLCTKENCIQLFKVANLHGLCTAKKRIEKFLLGNPELLLQHAIKAT